MELQPGNTLVAMDTITKGTDGTVFANKGEMMTVVSAPPDSMIGVTNPRGEKAYLPRQGKGRMWLLVEVK